MGKSEGKTKKGPKPAHEFQLNDLVAAKVRGYPTWPGFIEEIRQTSGNRQEYTVKFFQTGDRSTKFVELKPFEEMTASELKCKRKNFAQALEECRRMQQNTKQTVPETRTDMGSPTDDEDHVSRRAKVEPKADDLSKQCSLNDLTSEQANADRGNKPPTSTKATSTMQITERELTLAKLKRKINTKLREKEEKKSAYREQKSFEKALKGLPWLYKKLRPITKSSAVLITNLDNAKYIQRLKTSMELFRDNELRFIVKLARCLKMMTSKYGEQQKVCYDFHCGLTKIVTTLKAIKASKSHPLHEDCYDLLKRLRNEEAIKTFMNDMKFPLFTDQASAWKENSQIKQKESPR